MHVLIIPSEAFVPKRNPLEGIFQHHQAVALNKAGYKVGALSVELSYSVPMTVKGILFRLLRKKAGNATDSQSIGDMLKTGLGKFFRPRKFITKECLDGVVVYRIDALYRWLPVKYKNHRSWIKAGMICVDEYIKQNGKPDVVHAHEAITAGMLAQQIKARYAIPYIITEHSTYYATGARDEDLLKRAKRAFDNAAGLFAVSEPFAQFLNQLFKTDRFRYLPNVLDLQFEAETKRKETKAAGRFRFLNIALLKPVKDQQMLLNAFKKVVEKKPEVELAIAGFGILEAELKKVVEKNGLQNHVRFMGELGRDEVMEALSNCDCFVLSSKYETFGVVLIEALFFGKPVVSTQVGVAPNIINNQTGYMVPVGDENAMANALLKVTETQKNFDTHFIRNFTVANFGKEAFVKRLTKIYSEVV